MKWNELEHTRKEMMQEFRPKFEWAGIVASILAIGVVLTLISGEWGRHLSDPEATLINTILGAIVGALATYLGGARKNGDNGTGTNT